MVGIARPRTAPPYRLVNKTGLQGTKEVGVARTAKPRALFHGADRSDTEVSQLKLSSLGELGSLLHSPVQYYCQKRVEIDTSLIGIMSNVHKSWCILRR